MHVRQHCGWLISQKYAWSAKKWNAWVDRTVKDRARVFAIEPDDMVGAYHRERMYTKDYHGREFLELLQNADDAGIEGSRSQKSIVVLSEEGLCFANTGEPFSPAGIKSLMISDNSPKKYKARYIGNRGLGFRSVLSWTECPFILSGNLSIGFDKARAEDWLRELASKSERVKRKVEEVAEDSSVAPIPTLAVLVILNNRESTRDSRFDDSTFAKVWSAAQELRAEGYDTVIALPFTTAGAFSEAQEQLDQMGREVLLFLRSIQELILRLPGGETIWTARAIGESVEISSSDPDETLQTWDIHTRKGTAPSEFLKADHEDTADYEIKLAIPQEHVEGPGKLFSYFPTEVRFPFPLIAHATLELTGNRQHLVESKANAYLLGTLAHFMAETAESTTPERSLGGSDPWRPLSLITPRGDLDTVVEKLEFSDALIEAAKVRDLIPVRNGSRFQAAKARTLDVDDTSWLPDQDFEDVVLPTNDRWLLQIVKDLGTPGMTAEELRERLNRCSSSLSIPDHATLITKLIDTELMPEPPPDLLLDSNGKLIPANTVTYAPPVDGVTFDLPPWMPLRLLHGELASALRTAFGDITTQDLVSRLSEFELRPYSLAALAFAINARTNEIVTEQPDWEIEYRLAGLRSLFRLYRQSLQSGEHDIPRRPAELRVRIPNREGTFVSADTLYFGTEYLQSDLTEHLYGPLFPKKMVAEPASLELDADAGELKNFLSWLGVASEPRVETLRYLSDEEFQRYVYDQLDYSADFGDTVVHSASELSTAKIANVSWIDGLENIIDRADPHAIVAWLALDGRLEHWRINGDAQAELRFWPTSYHNYRTLKGQVLPSYVIWLLQRKKWLTASDGSKRAPTECTLATNLPDGTKAIFPHPALDESDERFRALKVDRRYIRFALERIGVNASLDDLSWDDFYALLRRLPELDPEGKHARAVYRALAARADDDGALVSSARENFLIEGKLWAQQRGVAGYYPVRDGIYYADDATVPQIIVREMRMLALDRRRGAQKVQRLFGAKPLSYRDIDVEIRDENVDEHPREQQLQAEVDNLKPYVYAMRLDAAITAQGLKRLHNLKVKLCRSATGLAVIDDDIHDISVSEGETLLSGDVAYVCSNRKGIYLLDRLLTDSFIAHDVGEILASLLNVESGGDFTTVAQCIPEERPALLLRMLGVDPEPLLDEARQKLKVAPELVISEDGIKGPLPPVPEPRQPADTLTGNAANSHSEAGTDETKSKKSMGSVDVKEKEYIISPPRKQIKKRVRATPSAGKARAALSLVTDPERCEELAVRFEEADGQDRYPLVVAHVQGLEGYGCDLLSFGTPEDRDRFRIEEDLSLVLRFIEVKGRSSGKGSISLKGNELKAATEHEDRYYVYRVFEVEDGKFELAVLKDPITGCQDIIYEVDLFRDARTARYEVDIA